VILVVVVFVIVFVLGIFFFRRRHFLSNNSWSFCLFACLFLCVFRGEREVFAVKRDLRSSPAFLEEYSSGTSCCECVCCF